MQKHVVSHESWQVLVCVSRKKDLRCERPQDGQDDDDDDEMTMMETKKDEELLYYYCDTNIALLLSMNNCR